MLDWVIGFVGIVLSYALAEPRHFLAGVLTLEPMALTLLVVLLLGFACLYWFVVRRLTWKRRLFIVSIPVLVIIVHAAITAHSKRYVPTPLSIDTESGALTRTKSSRPSTRPSSPART